jgi:hypothetical protein
LRLWLPGNIQIFVRKGGPTSSVHVIDEGGCFFNERIGIEQLDSYLIGLALFLTTLGQAPLTFNANREGKLKFALQEIVNVAEGDNQYQYRLAKWTGTGRSPSGVKVLNVRLSGSLMLRDSHDVLMVSDRRTREETLEPGRFVADLAAMIIHQMQEWECMDFAIIETKQTKGPIRYRQTVEYLGFRRALDRALRKEIEKLGGVGEVVKPKRQVGGTRIIEDWRN